MKELSREINRLLMEFDEGVDSRAEFDTINSIIDYATKIKYEMTHNEKGRNYFNLACDEMMNDISRYLERYRQNNELPEKDSYRITLIPASNGLKLSLIVVKSGIKIGNLQHLIRTFPRYNLLLILKLDSNHDFDYIKFNRCLVKEEYDKFLELRESNPDYFIPYIQQILKEMNNLRRMQC